MLSEQFIISELSSMIMLFEYLSKKLLQIFLWKNTAEKIEVNKRFYVTNGFLYYCVFIVTESKRRG